MPDAIWMEEAMSELSDLLAEARLLDQPAPKRNRRIALAFRRRHRLALRTVRCHQESRKQSVDTTDENDAFRSHAARSRGKSMPKAFVTPAEAFARRRRAPTIDDVETGPTRSLRRRRTDYNVP